MSMEEKKPAPSMHRLQLSGREAMELSGVTDVISFDEESVVLSTVCGNLQIEGAGLHIHVLSMEEGIVTLDGRVDAMTYYDAPSEDKSARGGFFGKLFH